ncbi:MAG: LysM peptidoglycan-binding domain-containing protein [Myxococcota bacterium]|nr:LysM peptidoglycan-binding domain-containing protein [Myxococcota bacterium]
MTPRLIVAVGLLFGLALAHDVRAFTHIVKPGEGLAQIAERVYGESKLEMVLVGANALDVQGGSLISPGMRLEIPAPGHHTVAQGETWAELAISWIGTADTARTDLLARTNKGVPWVPPVEGQEIEIPALITYIAGDGETVNSIAQRFWRNAYRGWELNTYNRRDGISVRRGEVVLVPMPGLRLTEAGKAEARAAAERDGASGGMAFEQQRRADAELPQLLAELRYGRYVEAVGRGNRLIGAGALTHPQLAIVQRVLLEAYVALDARAAAAAACAAWKSHEPHPVLDPVRVSPKIRAACDAR